MTWLKQLFGFRTTSPITFYNTLGKSLQIFEKAPRTRFVRMYCCGPTVYDRQHIGNLSKAVFDDVLRRVLEYNGMAVKQVINITDFGHLVSDADDGDDKMTKGLKREGLPLTMENMREFGTKYMNMYLEDIRALNVATDSITFPRASDYVPAMIAMIQTLEEKGYAYQTKDGVYFETSKFQGYGTLGGIDTETQKDGARVSINTDKRNPADFALWKSHKKLGWKSPWGKGFPGWHLECSAMINSILGKQIDIHTGGIEHISIHHNNEIAQSEAATGKHPFSRFWLHRNHIQMDNAKLAKSTGNVAYLSEVREHGIHPLALRYWFLTSHYRSQVNFTWEALQSAQTAWIKLLKKFQELKDVDAVTTPLAFMQTFREALNDDLDTPKAIATLWETLNAKTLTEAEQKAVLSEVDKVLALGLTLQDDVLTKLTERNETLVMSDVPLEIRELVNAREEARKAKNWTESDRLRDEMRTQGYEVTDTTEGPMLSVVK